MNNEHCRCPNCGGKEFETTCLTYKLRCLNGCGWEGITSELNPEERIEK